MFKSQKCCITKEFLPAPEWFFRHKVISVLWPRAFHLRIPSPCGISVTASESLEAQAAEVTAGRSDFYKAFQGERCFIHLQCYHDQSSQQNQS